MNDWRAAARQYRQAVSRNPAEPIHHNNLAVALYMLDRQREAIAMLDRAARRFPENREISLNRAKLVGDFGHPARAVQLLKLAIRLNPRDASLQRRLAIALSKLGQISESEAAWRRYLASRPRDREARNELGTVLCAQGRIGEGVAQFRRAGTPESASNLLLTMHYSDDFSPTRISEEHRRWGAQFEPVRAPAIVRSRRDVLRIGYVSGDLRRHSVACFFEPLLANHDRRRFEVHCFSTSTRSDATTRRLRQYAHWHDIASLGDEEAAALIGSEGIDVLVDLSGHTPGHRLPLFARRPAPVQISYLGYPNTTGLDAIDYRLTDSNADPPGADLLYSERLIRLDPVFLCYRPPLRRITAGPLPARENGYVTFGCFAIREKLSAAVLDAWAEILRQAPRARLLLKNKSMADARARETMHSFFADRGISRRRITLLPYTWSHREHVTYYRHVDVMLDPFPYNGTTATCESLWAGVPVLTWKGDAHVSRVGSSILMGAGISEFIAESKEDYVQRAVAIAQDWGSLALLRREMKRRLVASPLFDGRDLARRIEGVFRDSPGR